MKRSMSKLKRLLAALMVFALVIGYVPLGVVAETTGTPGTVQYEAANVPTVAVTRTQEQVLSPEEGSEGDQTSGEGESAEPAYKYTYTVEVTVNNQPVEDYTINWTVENETVTEVAGIDAAEATATVTYNGMTVSVTVSDANVGEDGKCVANATWAGVELCTMEAVQKGVYYTLPESNISNVAEGAVVAHSHTVDGAAPVDKNYTTNDTLNVVETITVNDIQVAVVTYNVVVEDAPVPSIIITGTEQEKWYSTEQIVTVTAVSANFADNSYLPSVTNGAGTVVGEWKGSGTSWTNTITVSETDTINCGDQQWKVQIDKVVPTVTEYDTYSSGILIFKEYYIEVHYTVGASGLRSVTVNDTEYTSDKWDDHDEENGIVYIQLPSKTNNPTVTVTNNAGVSSVTKTTGNSVSDMSAEITYTSPLKEMENNGVKEVYADENTVITLTISGAEDPNSDKGLDLGNTVVTVNDSQVLSDISWNYANGVATATITVPKNTVYKNITLESQNKRKHPQTIKETLENVSFINDATAPVLNVTANVDASATYFSGVGAYTFTVTDDHLNLGVGSAELNLKYNVEVNGIEEIRTVSSDGWAVSGNTYTKTIQIDDAQLISYEVSAKDNVGNVLTLAEGALTTAAGSVAGSFVYNGPEVICDDTAPEVTVTFSENVTAIYGRNNQVYLWLDTPVTGEDAEDVDVTMVVTVTDKNLVAMDGWTGEIETNKDASITYTKTITVPADATGVLSVVLTVHDKLGIAAAKVNVADVNNTSYPFDISVEDGQFELAFNIDRRRPTSTEGTDGAADTALPVISVTNDVAPVHTTADGLEIFAQAPSFTFSVNDGTAASGNSGLAMVKWTLKDANGFVVEKGATETYPENEDSVYSDTFNVAAALNGTNESNEVTLSITVVDAAGNAITHVKTFGVDTLAPRITYSYDNNNVSNGTFYNAVRNATVVVEDLNLNTDTITINGTEFTGEPVVDGIKNTYTVPFSVDGDYQMIINANDLAGWVAEQQKDSFTVDMTPAVITVTKTLAEDAELIASADGVDYYNGEVTYTIEIADRNLSETIPENGVNSADLMALFEDGTSDVVVALGDGWEITYPEDGMTHYTYTFTMKDGQVLTGIILSANDNANNPTTVVTCEDDNTSFNYAAAFNGSANHIYGGTVVVDETAPEIVVTKTVANEGKRVQTYTVDGVEYAYYADEVTYDIVVTDNFLTTDVGSCVVTVTYADGTEVLELAEDFVESDMLSGEDQYTYSFTLDGTRVMKNISFEVVDNAGNVAAQPDVAAASDTDFALTGNVWNYTGNPIVVDTTAPTAVLEFSENVKSFFVKDGVIYAILTTPNVEESGIFSGLAAEEVTVTITVQDKNLAIDNDNVNGVWADTFKWTGETPVNADTTITYVATTGKIKADSTAVFTFDVKVSDLAGNVLESFDSEVTADDTTFLAVEVDETGAFAYELSLDRLRPSSNTDDTTAPTITVTPSIAPTKTADGLDLFNGAFNFALNVTDGKTLHNNSGLKYVKWSITDANGVVAAAEVNNPYGTEADLVYSADYAINVALAQAQGESNEVVLKIIAEDNVGNQITFQKNFGVDTLAPRVTITQSNHSVQNDFYFKDDQVVTVEIEELNFDSTKSTVTTEVPFSGWQNVGGNVYRTTLTYNTDGDYTFAMATTDLANNAATIDYTTGLTALQSFTIDKTAPVIHVNFNPFVPVDTDGNLVQYFDDVRTVTVTIDEHNFRASDVVANLGPANALGVWSSNGDTHTASELFTEGNGYSVNVNYTDLAGNPAVAYTSPTFSIDLQAPVIELSKGNMTTGTLNIVSDDLLLGFTITDHQDNLKDFGVEVIFLDNNYQQTKVEGAEYYTVTDGDRTTGYIDFTNIEAVKANDGIYTVRVTARDYAGHVVNFPDVVFSLNRFGSTFTVSDSYTSSFLTADGTGVIYQNEVTSELVITEINPNRVWQDSEHTVEGSTITVAANGNSVTLVPGEDYTVTVSEMGTGSNKWYEYTYTISPDVFNQNQELVDGEYTIFFYSEDEAGNKNTNESNEGSALLLGSDGNYSGKVTFTLDHKAPVVTVLNIEEGGQYVEANKNVEINVSDNTPVSIAVYINDVLVEYVESAEGQPLTSDWLTYDPESGNYVLNMSEKDEVQNVRVVVTDAAGNVFEQTIGDITLTENLWVQFINNEVLVIGSIVGLIGLIILIILLLKKRKKKEEEETAAV